MTPTLVPWQESPVAQRLRTARQDAGLSLEDASRATGLIRSYLAALEDGRRRPLPGEVRRLAAAYDADLSDLLPPRRPVEVDAASGRIAVGDHERRVSDLADDHETYAAYLFLLYAVRGAAPGQRVPLRTSDLERLLDAVGTDATTMERRLVQLMGCSADEASRLRQVLLRSRALTAAAGAAAAMSWVVVTAPGTADPETRPAAVHATAGATALSGGSAGASYHDADDPDDAAGAGLEAGTPVRDVLDGTWSPSSPSQAGSGADLEP